MGHISHFFNDPRLFVSFTREEIRSFFRWPTVSEPLNYWVESFALARDKRAVSRHFSQIQALETGHQIERNMKINT